MKKKKFKVWMHIDTGIQVTVSAYDKQEACDLAAEKIAKMPNDKYFKQIQDNAEQGECNVSE